MGIFDFLMGPDINQGIEEYHATQGAVLLDVRTPEEYRQGHIPGSKNIPLYVINKAEEVISLDTPLFCLLSQRSKKPGGGLHAGENGIYQSEKHWRDHRI